MPKNYSETIPFGESQKTAGYFRSPLPNYWFGATVLGLEATEWFHVQKSAYRRDGGHLHHAGYDNYRISGELIDQDAAALLIALATLSRAKKLPPIVATIELIDQLSVVNSYQSEAKLDRETEEELRRYMAQPEVNAVWSGFSIGIPGFDKIWEAVRPRYVTVFSGHRIQYKHFFVKSYDVIDLTSGENFGTVWSPSIQLRNSLGEINDWEEELTRQGLLPESQ